MNKEEYNKLSTFDKIDFDIAMKMYNEHNSRIVSINDHLGEYYSYRDLEEAERLEEKDTLEEYKKALKEKCELIDKAIEYIDDVCLFSKGYSDYGDDLNPKHIVDILKGEDNE